MKRYILSSGLHIEVRSNGDVTCRDQSSSKKLTPHQIANAMDMPLENMWPMVQQIGPDGIIRYRVGCQRVTHDEAWTVYRKSVDAYYNWQARRFLMIPAVVLALLAIGFEIGWFVHKHIISK